MVIIGSLHLIVTASRARGQQRLLLTPLHGFIVIGSSQAAVHGHLAAVGNVALSSFGLI